MAVVTRLVRSVESLVVWNSNVLSSSPRTQTVKA
jgi:hypothetical protein